MGMQLSMKVLKDTKENKTSHDISDEVTGIATAHISISENRTNLKHPREIRIQVDQH